MFRRLAPEKKPGEKPSIDEMKSRFSRNNNLCLLAGAFLVYQVYQAFTSGEDVTWWFILIYALMFLALGALLWRNYVFIKKLDKQKLEMEEQEIIEPEFTVVLDDSSVLDDETDPEEDDGE